MNPYPPTQPLPTTDEDLLREMHRLLDCGSWKLQVKRQSLVRLVALAEGHQ